MSHEKKICNTALATHIETCHPAYTYTPMIIDRRKWEHFDKEEPRGLPAVVAAEVDQATAPAIAKAVRALPSAAEMREKLLSDSSSTIKALRKQLPDIDERLNLAVGATLETARAEAETRIIAEVTEATAAATGIPMDIANPADVIAQRERAADAALNVEEAAMDFRPFNYWTRHELRELGIFFTESVCYRPEGFAYAPCGEEFTLLPGESWEEKSSERETSSDELTESESSSTSTQSTATDEGSQTLTDSYEKTVKTEFGTEHSVESSFKLGIPFKLLKIDLGAKTTGSVDFSHMVTQTNKSSREDKRSFMRKVVQTLKSSTSASRKRKLTTDVSTSFTRNLSNDGDCPAHYVKRDQHCVYSVHHKRTNAQLAWSGCIDDPARDLCRPQDFEEDHADEIQAIRHKCANMPPSDEFGAKPATERRCTEVEHWAHAGNIFQGTTTFNRGLQASIPAGYGYVAGSADVEIVSSKPAGEGDGDITAQPSHGSSGFLTFGARLSIRNVKFSTEEMSFKVCFDVMTPAGLAWDDKVSTWREQQAQAEIDALKAKKEEEFGKFLLSERAQAEVERLMFAEYFGVTEIKDCCAFISRIRGIFDFSKLSYSLLPTWNHDGDHCQRSEPVSLYTAKCLQFYLPVREGMEWEALKVLIAIQAIPWNPWTAPQIWGYINAIRDMRDTLFSSTFDPTGWADRIDDPMGYQLTPYDTDRPRRWKTPYESSMSYQLIDAYTVTVPNGTRTDKRPALCEGECPDDDDTGGEVDDGDGPVVE